MESILLGLTVGLVAGLIPGAYSTVVATTALERGLRPGLKVALIPIGTELPALLSSVFILTRLPTEALRWIGIAGGLLLIGLGWTVIRGSGRLKPVEAAASSGNRGRFTRATLFGLLSPGSWAFWFLLGAPLLLSRWRVSPGDGILFLLTFFVCFVGAMLVLAWAVATGRRYLSQDWYRRTLKGAAGLLFVAGTILIWQSWEGNFSEMVQAPDRLEEELESSFRMR